MTTNTHKMLSRNIIHFNNIFKSYSKINLKIRHKDKEDTT